MCLPRATQGDTVTVARSYRRQSLPPVPPVHGAGFENFQGDAGSLEGPCIPTRICIVVDKSFKSFRFVKGRGGERRAKSYTPSV